MVKYTLRYVTIDLIQELICMDMNYWYATLTSLTDEKKSQSDKFNTAVLVWALHANKLWNMIIKLI